MARLFKKRLREKKKRTKVVTKRQRKSKKLPPRQQRLKAFENEAATFVDEGWKLLGN